MIIKVLPALPSEPLGAPQILGGSDDWANNSKSLGHPSSGGLKVLTRKGYPFTQVYLNLRKSACRHR
jgi:hypothetical protein